MLHVAMLQGNPILQTSKPNAASYEQNVLQLSQRLHHTKPKLKYQALDKLSVVCLQAINLNKQLTQCKEYQGKIIGPQRAQLNTDYCYIFI